jgi:hypothetical protein
LIIGARIKVEQLRRPRAWEGQERIGVEQRE